MLAQATELAAMGIQSSPPDSTLNELMNLPVQQAPTKILVVDDDSEIRGLLRRFLELQGMKVKAAADARSAHRFLVRELFDLIVLDLSLPDEDGLSVCKRIRESGNPTPILMLTARGAMVDRVVGLEMGADDYLAKPFEPRELVARIKAQVRGRLYTGHARSGPNEAQTIKFGRWKLCLESFQLSQDGKPVHLKPSEHALLRVFAAHANSPIGRDLLIALTRSFGTELNTRSIDVQVLRLRKLLEDDPANPRLIQTVWGVGYVFVPGPSFA